MERRTPSHGQSVHYPSLVNKKLRTHTLSLPNTFKDLFTLAWLLAVTRLLERRSRAFQYKSLVLLGTTRLSIWSA